MRTLTIWKVAILAFAAGLSMSFFTLPLWVAMVINGSRTGQATDWLGFGGGILGNLITAIVAAIAIYFAWNGIMQQLRVSLISREEERMERLLPGLRQIERRLSALCKTETPGATINCLIQFRADTVYEFSTNPQLMQLARFNELKNMTWEITDASIARELPFVDADNHHRISVLLSGLLSVTKARLRADDEAKQLVYRDRLEELRRYRDDVSRKAALYDRRLAQFRPELEAYFDR